MSKKQIVKPTRLAIEGPPGCGKTTYCLQLYNELSKTQPIIIVPELLVGHYNCGESNLFHNTQSICKENFALQLSHTDIGVLMDRCRISTLMVRITQSNTDYSQTLYTKLESDIYGNHTLSVSQLYLLSASQSVCQQRRRSLLAHESKIDTNDHFFTRLYNNYHLFYTHAAKHYPEVEVHEVITD